MQSLLFDRRKKTGQKAGSQSIGRSRWILLSWGSSSGARSSVSSRRGSRSSARSSSSSSVSGWSSRSCLNYWSWGSSSRSGVNYWSWGHGGFFFFAACGQSNSHQGDDQQGFFHGFSLNNSRVKELHCCDE
jgi:hypothetical protein